MTLGDQPTWSRFRVFLVFIFPATGGLLFGFDIGATSYVLTQLQDEHASGVSWYGSVADSSVIQGAITSAGVAGALIGSIIVFRVADAIGRRREMQIASLLYMVGAVTEAISGLGENWPSSVGITILLVGRGIYGVACGFAMHGAPSYIAEMSPPEVRGTLVSLKEALIVVGMLLGYGIGYALSNTPGGWRWTFLASVAPAIVMALGVTHLPPSARWLALTGQAERARASLNYVYSSGAESVLAEVLDQAEEVKQLGVQPLFSSRNSRALVAGIGVVTLQQITGQPSILYYANTIFSQAGLSSYAAVLTGAFKLLATLSSVLAVDRFGRRLLLFVGVSVMLLALVTMTFAFYGYDADGGSDDRSMDWRTMVIIVGMFAYIGGYQVSFGPIAWLLISEIFPLEVRGEAVAVAVQSNFFWNLVVTFVYPELIDGFGAVFGKGFAYCAGFGLFAALTLYSLFFIYWYVPETKGMSLEEIERFLRSPASRQGSTSGQERQGRSSAKEPLIAPHSQSIQEP